MLYQIATAKSTQSTTWAVWPKVSHTVVAGLLAKDCIHILSSGVGFALTTSSLHIQVVAGTKNVQQCRMYSTVLFVRFAANKATFFCSGQSFQVPSLLQTRDVGCQYHQNLVLLLALSDEPSIPSDTPRKVLRVASRSSESFPTTVRPVNLL